MPAEHDCERQRRLYGVCTICAAAPPAAQLALGEARCVFCPDPLDPQSPRTFQMLVGWARPRQQGGTNALSLRREVPGQYAHAECIDAAKAGRLDQPPLPLVTGPTAAPPDL